MRSVRGGCIFLILILFQILGINPLHGQSVLKGKIRDANTKAPISGATVSDVSADRATSADGQGQFQLPYGLSSQQLEIRAIGYKTTTVAIPKNQLDWIIELQSDAGQIEEISIEHKKKYSNKNNPAVELIDLVIRHKRSNRLSGKDSLQFDQYDKLKVGFVNPKPIFKRGSKNLRSFFENIDSLSVPGKNLLTIYMEESNAKVYGQQSPSKFKKQIHSQQKTELDKRYVNNTNIQQFINYLFQQVDVYDESVFLVNKQFLSPIADNGKLFYKYYITDTIFNEQGYFIQLNFEPRNAVDLLFTGSLQISMDGTYAVKEADLKVDEKINLNWVKDLSISFNYQKNDQGIMLLDSTQTFMTFGARKGDAVFASHTSVNSQYQIPATFPSTVFQGAPLEVLPSAGQHVPQRPIALNTAEQKTYANMEALNQDRGFKTIMALGYLAAQGYYNLGKFELGPLEYIYSRNNIEGNRFRLGGRTTQELTDKAYVEGYLAYGADDARLKYFLRTAVTLNGQSVVTFPAHYIEASIQNDILEPGQQISFLKGDSFFRSIRKNRPTKWFDTQAYQLQHVIEFGNHLSVTTGFTHMDRNTVGNLRLVNSGNAEELLTHIQTNEVHVDLRWAPNEKFYYRNLSRKTVIEKYPVFNLMYTRSLDGFLKTNFAYEKLTASVSKRFFLDQLGFADLRLNSGKIWGTLPYTLLELPNVKQKEDRHTIDFDMMNPMEFVADEYVKFSVFHEMQGFLFNKIPLLKRLNLREVWGGQMFYGRLNDRNNPYRSDQVVEFDTDEQGQTLTHVPNRTAYLEGSVGVDNILRILRVEYVKRLTYQDLPDVTTNRFRVSLHINF